MPLKSGIGSQSHLTDVAVETFRFLGLRPDCCSVLPDFALIEVGPGFCLLSIFRSVAVEICCTILGTVSSVVLIPLSVADGSHGLQFFRRY